VNRTLHEPNVRRDQENPITLLTMSARVIINSACSAEFFHFAQGMVLSIRDKVEGKDIDIGYFDLGMSEEQRAWMIKQGVEVVQPQWEFGLSDSEGLPLPFRAILCRPHLPKYFPGRDIYLHIDADAWVQDWSAVELYRQGASRGIMAVTPEIDRSFICNYRNARAYREFIIHIYTDLHGPEVAAKYRDYPIFNTGVFAIPAGSPIWQGWQNRISEALSRKRNFHVEQCSINFELFENFDRYVEQGLELLPARCNWVCHQSLPMFDAKRECLVEPFLPHEKLGIVHRASDDFKQQKTGTIKTTDGGVREMNLKYREGVYGTGSESREPDKLGRWQDAGYQWSA